MSWTWRDVVATALVAIVALICVDRWDAGHHQPTPFSGATA